MPATSRDIEVFGLRSQHTVTSVQEASRERNADAPWLGRGRRGVGGGAAREDIDDDRVLRGNFTAGVKHKQRQIHPPMLEQDLGGDIGESLVP